MNRTTNRALGVVFGLLALVLSFRLSAQTTDDLIPPPDFALNVQPQEVKYVTKVLNKALNTSGFKGRVRSCTTIVDVTMGRVSSNHSYGAICQLVQAAGSSNVLLCADELVGHFELTRDVDYERESVARFIRENCVGG